MINFKRLCSEDIVKTAIFLMVITLLETIMLIVSYKLSMLIISVPSLMSANVTIAGFFMDKLSQKNDLKVDRSTMILAIIALIFFNIEIMMLSPGSLSQPAMIEKYLFFNLNLITGVLSLFTCAGKIGAME